MDEEVIALLQDALQDEFLQWDLYYAYKDQLTGGGRDPIMEHFEEHADDEAGHIELLQRYLINCYNTQPEKKRKEVPVLVNPTTEAIIRLQLEHEMAAVEKYKHILKELENKEECKSLIIDVENILTDEQEHVHDLQMYIKVKAVAYILPKELEDYMTTLGIDKVMKDGVWKIKEEHVKLLRDFVKKKKTFDIGPKRVTIKRDYR